MFPPACSLRVSAGIDRDPHEPGFDTAFAAVCRQRSVCLDECFLNSVLRQSFIPQVQVTQPKSWV